MRTCTAVRCTVSHYPGECTSCRRTVNLQVTVLPFEEMSKLVGGLLTSREGEGRGMNIRIPTDRLNGGGVSRGRSRTHSSGTASSRATVTIRSLRVPNDFHNLPGSTSNRKDLLQKTPALQRTDSSIANEQSHSRFQNSLGAQHNNIRIGRRVRSKGLNTSPRISRVTTPRRASSPSSPRMTGV